MRISDWSSDVFSSELGQPQRVLAGLAGVRAVLEHEHPAARRGNLAQEARHHGIPQFNILGLGLGHLHGGLGELDLCHDDSLERPGFQEPDRSGARENRVKFQKARSEEHTSELQSLMRISYAVFCLKKKINANHIINRRVL